jgi:N-acetylglutamate synthase-like GNAT family acetyltransferase
MIIKLLECADNIQDYIDCTKELNNAGVALSSIEEIQHSLSTRPSNILTFVMVNDDNRIVATATLIMEKKLRYKNLCCHIEDVGVHPDYRGLGYGAEIVGYCKKVGLSNQCYKIKLNCDDKLVGFYTKLGFEVNGKHMFIKGDNNE